ncbi:MAG: GntR family transcriptional regulator [Desulfarculaceae bacterium]|jgi:DNA-binding GntR family transcriptional regulator
MRRIEKISFEGAGLAEQISQTLIQAILKRTLRGGDRLVETELQKTLGVSRSPLREAFRDLEKKGLVVIRPRRGTFVKKITRQDIEEHYPVLASLEGLAARQAHPHMDESKCKKLAGHLKAMDRAAQKEDVKSFLDHHAGFHQIYIEASRNQLLIALITDLRLRGTRLRYFFPHTPDFFQESLEMHQGVMKYLCDAEADLDMVERVVKDHINQMLARKGWEI